MADPGLGYDHEQERARQLERLRDGTDLCPRCRRPMDRRRHRLDLDDFPARVLCELYARMTGRVIEPTKLLAHARCNRAAGARLGNQLRAMGIVRPSVARSVKPRRRPARRRAW